MNAFVVSARKYRPATFDTVVGQAHITDTLKNAIRTHHLAQAFLFCGPRGVGKTTCARILAKTLNCKTLTADMEACNECESCKSFNSGQSLNIYELDAASNNSVDDIRNLVEQVRYAPHSGEYKIYIIDEVHMLSSSAFNAFLKTLEEPPSYAVFILATTEKHKIIPTILSHCQIFDFNRIQVDDITKHLEYVAKQEEVSAEEEALHIIAQKADGALRDALSIFDQIVSFAGTNITYKDVINNLSILDYDYYFKITDEIREGNIPGVLLTYNELISDGFDGHHFITGLASHFRDLLVSKTESTLSLLEVSRSARERYKLQASEIVQANLLKYLSICSKCDIEYRNARNQRLHVELALIRLCSISGMLEEAPIVSAPAIQKKSEVKTEVKKEVAKKSEVAEPSSPPIANVVAETPEEPAAVKISVDPAPFYFSLSFSHSSSSSLSYALSIPYSLSNWILHL
ncbi:MAG: DNA polymerase III subunit gamma/tau [Bacteroidetes bacterium]|nr:DNA polymerase III subunit gamma/tau [Bacteroidota bacterium]